MVAAVGQSSLVAAHLTQVSAHPGPFVFAWLLRLELAIAHDFSLQNGALVSGRPLVAGGRWTHGAAHPLSSAQHPGCIPFSADLGRSRVFLLAGFACQNSRRLEINDHAPLGRQMGDAVAPTEFVARAHVMGAATACLPRHLRSL